MKKAKFDELLQSVRDAGADMKGKRVPGARLRRIEPDSVTAVRARLKMSQSQFAHAFGISIDTLQNWEQGRRKPSGPAKILLKVATRHPQAVLEAVA